MVANPSRKHLVLLGAGRAHLRVLKGLAQGGVGGMNVTLVAPHTHYIEADMLPGYVAGNYAPEDFCIPLEQVVNASGAALVLAQIHALDPVRRRVHLSSGDALPYDVLSINAEPVLEREQAEARMPGARQRALFTCPLPTFIQLWPQVQALARERALQVAVIGHGLPVAELAMAAAHALSVPHGSRVTLLTGDAPLLHAQPAALQRRVLARLKALNVTVLQDHCTGIDGHALHLACGARLVCDAPILAAGASTPGWLVQSGMQLDEAGQPAVNPRLQSQSHRQVFVVPPGAPAEVGIGLETNLRTALGDGVFRKVRLDRPSQKVVTSGDRHAIAVWGPLGLEGREVWHWKDRRDRRQLATLFT